MSMSKWFKVLQRASTAAVIAALAVFHTSAATAAEQTIDDIIKKGTIVVGVSTTTPIFGLIGKDGEPTRFTSGLVPGGASGSFPDIDISLTQPGASCFGTFIHLAGRVVDPQTLVPYGLQDGSSFTMGCLPPCLCPILFQTAAGSFHLLPIHQTPTKIEFAVVDIQWQIGSEFPSPSSTPVA